MAYKIVLNAADLKELRDRKKNQTEGKILRRLMAMDMKRKGMKNKDIADYCSVCVDTITDWFFLFEQGGFESLCSLRYEGRRVSKLEQHKEAIQQKEQDGEINSLKELRSWLREEHNTHTCLSNLFYFCKKNSIFLTKKPD